MILFREAHRQALIYGIKQNLVYNVNILFLVYERNLLCLFRHRVCFFRGSSFYNLRSQFQVQRLLCIPFYQSVVYLISEPFLFWRYGAYLISIDLMSSSSVYRVFFAIAFCAVSVGQATSFIPDYNKAKLAAGLIFHLIEEKSKIDPFNAGGLRPVR